MNDDDITAKLIDKYVTVTSVDLFKEAIVREGVISSIKPRMSLDFGPRGRDGTILFVGMSESILHIIDENDRLLYQNEAALDAYKGKFLEDADKRKALREQGVFYLDD